MKLRCFLVASLAVAALVFAADNSREPAPRFHAKTMSGETFDNASIKGKVVLLEFWATWCQYCRTEQPTVDALQKEFTGQGLIVLAVDVGEAKKTVKKYLEQNPRQVRIVLTDDTNLTAMYQATRYPIYVVIDRGGFIAGQQNGAAGERALRGLLRRAGLGAEVGTATERE